MEVELLTQLSLTLSIPYSIPRTTQSLTMFFNLYADAGVLLMEFCMP